MEQLLFGAIILVGLIAAFWLTARMPPKVAVSPEEWMRSRVPGSRLTDLVLSVASSVGTAAVFGGAIALHRWPDAVVYFINLGALVGLLILQLSASERGFSGALPKSNRQGHLNGLLCPIYGIGLLISKTPTDWFELGILLLLAVALVVRLAQEVPAAPSALPAGPSSRPAFHRVG